MKYELHYTWANGFYEGTRKFKRLNNAVNAYLLQADMLTNTVTLSEITADGKGKLLLSKHRHFVADELKGFTGKLLNINGKRVKVVL